ncbi:MAG: glycosyltransferase family 4 protein [Bacteroidetes bacterium]|nr:glycosyltransferase family 4 protein [Bacteroidota bacterium]
MKIAVNCRLLLKNKLEGIGWFTYETMRRITQQHKEHQFYFLFDQPYPDEFIFSENITPILFPPQARHPFLYYLWFEYSVPHILKKINPDLFFSPDGYLSLSSLTKSMHVIHDLSFEHYPKDVPYFERKFYQHYFPKYAQKAARIATVSEYSKNDIIQLYGVSSDKIDVVFNGASDTFQPLSENRQKQVRDKYTGGNPYFIFVGALHPRKNLVNLFKAFDLFCKDRNRGIKLMIVGEKMWWTKEIRNAYEQMSHRDEVVFSGRLAFSELTLAVGSAVALTYVSYFEGFGIPIMEAFYSGTPVITSNITSMPEVAGDAAVLTDPFSPESICDAMVRISEDESLRKSLIARGNERKKNFSWQKTTDLLWKSIEHVL